ncbi:MAG: ABC transporter permease [Burkholderiaceae bacterium]|nr:ABC transporter permease [Burkholderiaceae bacterium]
MSGFFARSLGAAKREFQRLVCTPWEWVTTIVLPLIWCVLLTGLFNDGLMRELPLGVVDLDKTHQSQTVQGYMDALPSVQLRSVASPQAAQSAIRTGELFGYVVIPEDWTRNAKTPNAAAIEIYVPKSLYAIGVNMEIDLKSALLAYSNESFQQMAHAVGANETLTDRWLRTLSVNTVLLGNIAFNFHAYLLATVLPGLLGLCTILVIASNLVREFRDKTLDAWVASADGSVPGAIVGKVGMWTAVYWLFGLGYLAYFAGFSGWGTEAAIGLWAAAILTFLFVMATFAVLLTGLLIRAGWVIVLSISIGITAPIYPYTGFSYPIESMTTGAQWLAQTFPLTHFLKLQSSAWVLQPPAGVCFIQWLTLAAFAIVALAIGLPLLAKRVKEGADHA